MQTSPTAAELVTAVREFLETKVAPALTGHTAFHARVAVNALAIVERELTLGPDAQAREQDRLESLLGQTGSLAALNAALAKAVREGHMGPETPGLLEHLRLTTLDTVAIDQPHYSGYRDAVAAEQQRAGEGDRHGDA